MGVYFIWCYIEQNVIKYIFADCYTFFNEVHKRAVVAVLTACADALKICRQAEAYTCSLTKLIKPYEFGLLDLTKI